MDNPGDSGEVVSRKPFLHLPWQGEIWHQWLQQIQQDRLPHALLLSGLPGLGKRTLARALAHFLLCEQRQPTAPCGQCPACQMLSAGFHPDWYWIAPEAEGKQIRVDQIREMNGQVQQTAQRGGYKLVMICPAEAMNLNAANALLKTLEEPEPRTQFVLVSDRPSSLPATLRSRCQQWKMTPPPAHEGIQWLAHQLSSDQSPESLLRAAGGRPLQALKMADVQLEAERQLVLEVLTGVTLGQDIVPLAARLKQLPLQSLLAYLLNWLADTLRLMLLGEAGVQDLRQLSLYQLWQTRLSWQTLLQLEHRFRQQQGQLANNPNTELFIEQLFITLTKELGHE